MINRGKQYRTDKIVVMTDKNVGTENPCGKIDHFGRAVISNH